jgi:hypothetical protein
MRVSGQGHAPAALYPGEKTTGTQCIVGLVGLRAALDTEVGEKSPLPGIEPRSRGSPKPIVTGTKFANIGLLCVQNPELMNFIPSENVI